MPAVDPPRLPVSHLTVAQAARYLKCEHNAVLQRVARGTLPAIELFGTRMIAAADLYGCYRQRVERGQIPHRTPTTR